MRLVTNPKQHKMTKKTSRSDHERFQLLEILDECHLYAPMTWHELHAFVAHKWQLQPIGFFNDAKNLYVIELGNPPTIRPLSIKIEV
jgi:hypothetical protein